MFGNTQLYVQQLQLSVVYPNQCTHIAVHCNHLLSILSYIKTNIGDLAGIINAYNKVSPCTLSCVLQNMCAVLVNYNGAQLCQCPVQHGFQYNTVYLSMLTIWPVKMLLFHSIKSSGD